MGSSKKHKEKSRDKDTEDRRREHKKHRHKERDRDGSDRDKDKRKRSRSRDRVGRESRSKGEKSSGEPRVKKEKLDLGYEEGSADVGPQSASGDASLSIEETNKLRAKLGLKPLELNENKKELGTKEEPIVAETINPVVIQQQKEIREKLAALKEKRILNQKLGKVKTLAEDDWLDDTSAWVERSRKLAKEKEMAEKRAKLLEEMDEEFGVSSLVEEEFAQSKHDAYTARDLKGLKVQHKVDSFSEGQTVILTLQDKGVLEEEEDVLVNVNMVDKEKAEKNVELKKKKPDYKPYEEEESVDDMVSFKRHSVLSKYDEEIEGEKKKSFRLNTGGFADGERERELQAMREALRNQAQSLEMPSLTIASEYYTPQEMVGFKKTKRSVKKIRKKEKLTIADDLMLDDTRSTDFGSRTRGRGRREADDDGEGVKVEEEETKMSQEIPLLSDDIRTAEMDISDEEDFTPPEPTVIEEDEAEQELQKQLAKQRKLKQKQLLKDSGEKVAAQIKDLDRGDNDNDPEKRNNIVFNATSEFCRTLGDIPTYGLSGNRDHPERVLPQHQPLLRVQLPHRHHQLPAAAPAEPPAELHARRAPLPARAPGLRRPSAAAGGAERGAADGARPAQQRRLASDVSHRPGDAGEDQGGAQEAEEPASGHQVPAAQAGAHRAARGEGEVSKERQPGAVQHGVRAPGPGGPAQTEGADTCEQRLSADAHEQDGGVLIQHQRLQK